MSQPKNEDQASQSTKPDDGELKLFALEVENGEVIKKPISQTTYGVVGDEVLTEKLDPMCWAKALAEGAKTKDEALSIYAKLRAEELAGKLTLDETKAKALEERKLAAGLPDSHFETRIVWRKKFSLMWDFIFWQILLSVSGVGLFLVILAMGTDSRWWPGLLPLVVVSACLQLSPIVFYGLGKLVFGKVRYTQALATTAVGLIALGGVMGMQTLTEKKTPSWLKFAIQRTVDEHTEPQAVVTSDEEF